MDFCLSAKNMGKNISKNIITIILSGKYSQELYHAEVSKPSQ